MMAEAEGGGGAKPPRRAVTAALMAASFLAAFLLAWLLFGRTPPPPEQQPARDIAAADLEPFLAAVRAGDYPRMAETGNALFVEGSRILDREAALSGFEVGSFPPHQVYAFYTAHRDDAVYRVLLTLDRDDRVASFLAEDMPVVR